MKKTVRVLCVLPFLTGCSSLQKTTPSKVEKPQEQASLKIATPADIHYPKSPSIEDHNAQTAIVDDNPIDGTLLNGYAGFSQKSLSVILKTASDSVSYSSLNLYYPLIMTLQASEGQTAEQLQMLLHIDGRDSAKNMGDPYRRLYTDNESGQSEIANSLQVQNSYLINKDFIETANKQFYVAAYDVGFSQAKTADLVTVWICEHTNGNLSPSMRTNESICMVTFNAVYYKVRSDTELGKRNTKKDIFYAQDGKVDTDFMHKEMGSHFFTDSKDYTATSLTLSSSFSLTLVLPKEGKDIHRMMEQKGLLQELLGDDTKGANLGIVKLSLLKSKVHSKLQLADTLKAMGVTSLFDIAAELNSITNEKPFFVSGIQQETNIALNEEGTEASAYAMIGATGAANMEHPEVLGSNLGRPFLYAISTRMDGAELPFFIGVCSNPVS